MIIIGGSKMHCESCGRENPNTDDGYTTCCNEPTCDGSYKEKYGFPDNYVVACCWGKAEEKFEEQGKKVENGMSRL